MRTIAILLALLAVPAAASAEQSKASLTVGVTVVAACPPGSGKPCGTAAAVPQDAVAASEAASSGGPIAVLRDEAARTLTLVY